ncbi:MAG: SDR family oxidoreductase [Micromonosporaceae bacterium]
MPRTELRGKVVAVTGAARGIGAATAAAMHGHGAKVAIGDLDLTLTAQTAAGISDDVLALPLDVSDLAGYTRFLDEVERQLGPIDILVNNAGIMPVNLLEDESPESTARLLRINLHAVIHGTREALVRMKPRNTGYIVNVASTAGKTGVPGAATYSATKHGVVGLSDAVRHELKGTGIGISIVLPGVVRTELTTGVADTRLLKISTPDEVAAQIVAGVRAGRFQIYVPRMAGWMERVVRPFGTRLSDWILKQVGADRLMLDAVHSAERTRYEERAAASAPAADTAGADPVHPAASAPAPAADSAGTTQAGTNSSGRS